MQDNLNEVVDVEENFGSNSQKLPVAQYGGDPVNFVDFMRDYYMYGKAYGWPDKIMVIRLPLYLKGAARDAYCQLNAAQLDTWAHCKDALAEKLVSGDVGRIMRKKFYNRTQSPNESVSEFSFELSTLAEKAFGLREHWGDHIKNILQDQFVMGVHQHIRTALSLVDYQNFEDLVKKAMRIEVNSNMTTKSSTINYTEMAKFQRPQSESSNFNERSSPKPRTFNPPSPRNNRSSPKFNKNNNFQTASPKRVVTCFRCQMKGHTANQCRTNLSNTNRDNKRKVIKCENCGRMGHLTRDCYALKSRSPSTSPSPQRNRLNFKGQQQCYSCQKFGHISRSCPNNADRFQKPILKKSVQIDNNPIVNATFSPEDNFSDTFEAEVEEMRRKLNRFTMKNSTDRENENSMIFFGDESEMDQEVIGTSNQNLSRIDDVVVDKSRMLYSHLSNNLENTDKFRDDTILILQELSEMNLSLDKLENIMIKCTLNFNKGVDYMNDMKVVMAKI